jgi:RNase P/RNase MRP subunit POP5
MFTLQKIFQSNKKYKAFTIIYYMKPLIPSHKENKRYLLVQGKELKKNIEKAILEFSGTFGLAKCGLSFISSDLNNNSAVICINRESVDLL